MTVNPRTSSSTASWFAIVGCAIILAGFFAYMPGYGPGRLQSLLRVLYDSWNGETRYEHGVMFPFIIVGLFIYQWKNIRQSAGTGEWYGLIPLLLGCLLFVASYRVIQWRVGVGALPFIVSGIIWYLWGRKTALVTAFPVFYLWLSIPLPDVQQATGPLQNISVKISQTLCTLCGVDTYAQGAKIYSTRNNWAPLAIDEACSGIRSLMALIMISSAWAYVAKMALWKRAILFFSAIPLSIIGNGLRVASIFIMAEYGNEKFARETWHDNSGLLLFYPISLLLMVGLHAILEGGLPWKNRKVVRIINTETSTPSTQAS